MAAFRLGGRGVSVCVQARGMVEINEEVRVRVRVRGCFTTHERQVHFTSQEILID